MNRSDVSIRLARTTGGHPALQSLRMLLEMRIDGGYAQGAVAFHDRGRFTARTFDCHDETVLACLRQPRWHERTPRVRPRVDTSTTFASLVLTVSSGGVARSFRIESFASGFEGEDEAELERFLWFLHRAAGVPWETHGG